MTLKSVLSLKLWILSFTQNPYFNLQAYVRKFNFSVKLYSLCLLLDIPVKVPNYDRNSNENAVSIAVLTGKFKKSRASYLLISYFPFERKSVEILFELLKPL